MAEVKSATFSRYLPLLLNALRSKYPESMRPDEAVSWIRANAEVPVADPTRAVWPDTQFAFEKDVHWARFYLVKEGLLGNAKRGLWNITPKGRETRLSPEDIRELEIRIWDAAPGCPEDIDEAKKSHWFVGSVWHGDDQLARFLDEEVWENGHEDRLFEVVRRIRRGDRSAIKASLVKKKQVPFDVGGASVSAMRIKATGTVLDNANDGRLVKVAWDPPANPRDWYFYTYRNTIAKVDPEAEDGRRLIDFAFRGAAQDYAWFLAQPYWAEKYDARSPSIATDIFASPLVAEDEEIVDEQESYKAEDIVRDGCFLSVSELSDILDRWRSKTNLILQGPPGTGKTWLAKRLGFALAGSNDRETVTSRLRVVQFHPSLAYEDFVRGWRPAGDGRLELVDGILMQAIQAAESEPDRPFVLVIEEINRGNPAQIFGEMLTLLEASKRRRSEAIELAYRKEPGERVHMPANLYVIGTMNVADRSLAIVDLALRRRFAFIDLEPRLGEAWLSWCRDRGIDASLLMEIQSRMAALNAQISAAVSLGPQFRIGHSYVTPETDTPVADGLAWFRGKVETEIGPLLDEYWFDVPETAKAARAKLLAGLG